MTAFHSSPRMLGQKQDKFWLTVGLCALTAALIFLPFYLLDGGFFHYAGDFNSQQISFYRYMNGFLKGAGYPTGYGGVKNTFSWATDLGSGTMNAYSFYLYGSPFFWFSLLFPQNWLPYLMVPLLVLKFAVAGGGAYLYLRRYVQNQNYAVLGAVLYAFSGWGLYNIFFNHFIDVLALFPWMLWALDETIYERRHGWFAFWVAVNLLNNYFFFAGQAVFLDWMTRVKESPLLGILLGLSMTMVVQSSSATIALLQNVARQAGPDGIHSVLGLAGAVPVLLGDNIGTTVTALLACIGQGKDAARAALAHSCFNLSGSLLAAVLLPWFVRLVELISPKGPELEVISRQIANAHTAFNVCCTLLWLPFLPWMVRLVCALVPEE